MTALSDMETDPILAAYDFSRFATIVDVCGGKGVLFAEILRHTPKSQGVLIDARAIDSGAETVIGPDRGGDLNRGGAAGLSRTAMGSRPLVDPCDRSPECP
jgi:hypothetical protein